MNDSHPTKLAKTKKGEYIRLTALPSAPVWVRGDYDRATKKYALSKFDDANHTTLRAGSTTVHIGFTF